MEILISISILVLAITIGYIFEPLIEAKAEFIQIETKQKKIEYEKIDREMHPEKYMSKEEIETAKRIEKEQEKIAKQYEELANFTME